MAPRPSRSKADDPETMKLKVDKAKIEKPKVKADKVKPDKVVKAKTEKTEKVKAVTGDEANEMILVYLKAQNRPFSATEVSANLHGKVTKTIADKMLKEMMNGGQILGKGTNGENKGSQFVYWCLQDPADSATPEELNAMDISVSTLRSSLPSLRNDLKALTTKLTTLKSAPTTSELQLMVQGLLEVRAEKQEKLRGIREGDVKQVSTEEMERVEKEYKYWAMRRTTRKRCFQGLEDMLMQGMAKEDIWEKAGIEGDEE